MFMEIGIKIDNFLADVACFNRKLFWYKIFAYYFLKRNLTKKAIEFSYKYKCIYRWQYKRLIRLEKELNND